jgi:hypothetical protein
MRKRDAIARSRIVRMGLGEIRRVTESALSPEPFQFHSCQAGDRLVPRGVLDVAIKASSDLATAQKLPPASSRLLGRACGATSLGPVPRCIPAPRVASAQCGSRATNARPARVWRVSHNRRGSSATARAPF